MNNDELDESEKSLKDSSLPTYLEFLDNFFIATFLIPICCWLFFSFYFKGLPFLEYKKILISLWSTSFVFFLFIWVIEFIVLLILKKLGLKIFENDGNGGRVFKIKKVYKIFLEVKKLHQIFILYVIHSRFLIMLIFGWLIFGGITTFFFTEDLLELRWLDFTHFIRND